MKQVASTKKLTKEKSSAQVMLAARLMVHGKLIKDH